MQRIRGQKPVFLAKISTFALQLTAMAGLYIHIPFCESRCIYCGFYSTTALALRTDYTDAVIAEMRLRAARDPWNTYTHDIGSVYIGGGTPSVLQPSHLTKLFDAIHNIYNVKDDAEITIECNPDDVTPSLAQLLTSLGINRVSMGVQSFCNERLQWLGRRHTSAQVYSAVECLRKAGITNISLDLIYGFPGQTTEQWREDVGRMVELEPEHISAYSLMIEEGTTLCRMVDEGKVCEVDEGTSVEMYRSLVEMLTSAGYEHYEISNFAKPGRRARHNSSYWADMPYIGIGAGAHGYSTSGSRTRHANVCNIREYISKTSQGELAESIEEIDEVTHYNDLITTQLRTSDGLPLASLSPTLRKYMEKESAPHIMSGRLCITNNRLHLTESGIFVSDSIMSDLIFLE